MTCRGWVLRSATVAFLSLRRLRSALLLLAPMKMIPTTRTRFPEDGRLARVPALGGSGPWREGYRRPSIIGKGIRKTRPPRRRPYYPNQRDGDRTEESCQQDSRKHENPERNLVPTDVPFST